VILVFNQYLVGAGRIIPILTTKCMGNHANIVDTVCCKG